MDGGQRHPHAQRAEQARRIDPRADHGGVKGAGVGFAGDRERDAAGAADVRDVGVEFKFDAHGVATSFLSSRANWRQLPTSSSSS